VRQPAGRDIFNEDVVQELEDMDGTSTVTIRNPTYDSLYKTQTIA